MQQFKNEEEFTNQQESKQQEKTTENQTDQLNEILNEITNAIQVQQLIESPLADNLTEEEKQVAEEDGVLVGKETEEGEISFISLRISEFETEKEYKRFINAVKRMIRSSPEYKRWLCFLRDNLNLTVSPFTLETLEETDSIEIHHHPITLEELVEIVVHNKLEKGKSFTSFDIAREVLELHYKMQVGVIPLTETEHSKYHEGNLLIPIEFVAGNWQAILEKYRIPDEIYRKILSRSEIKLKDVVNYYSADERNKRYIGLFNLDKNEAYQITKTVNFRLQNEEPLE